MTTPHARFLPFEYTSDGVRVLLKFRISSDRRSWKASCINWQGIKTKNPGLVEGEPLPHDELHRLPNALNSYLPTEHMVFCLGIEEAIEVARLYRYDVPDLSEKLRDLLRRFRVRVFPTLQPAPGPGLVERYWVRDPRFFEFRRNFSMVLGTSNLNSQDMFSCGMLIYDCTVIMYARPRVEDYIDPYRLKLLIMQTRKEEVKEYFDDDFRAKLEEIQKVVDRAVEFGSQPPCLYVGVDVAR